METSHLIERETYSLQNKKRIKEFNHKIRTRKRF